MSSVSHEPEHWADQIAARAVARGPAHVISTGISPSGEIHIGNMREVLTADAVYRALAARTSPVRFNYVADNFDPLRRVYPFLDRATYEPLIGRPLSEIPCPCGAHASYGDHFLEPFLAALARLDVHVEVERGDALYKSGRMTPYVIRALEERDLIAAILHELTGKAVEPAWSPFTPLCAQCGRITHARVLGFSAAAATIDYACDCGAQATVPIAGSGKLAWRIDWPARWSLLGVTVEPFGKDHATRGGSYDTGQRIAREVFGRQPPLPVAYEWIRLKGQGDMSSSRGNVLSIAAMLEVVPPEVLRYLVLREAPQRTIDFDPGLPLLRLVDAFDEAAAAGVASRAIELSLAGAFRPVGVPFKHLVVVAQAAGFDPPRVLEILRRTGYPAVEAAALAGRLDQARRWLERFAPEDLRFTVQPSLPVEAQALDATQRRFLGRLAEALDARPEVFDDGELVHQLIYELAAEFAPVKPAALFEAVYLSLLGKRRGPRAGWFLSLLGARLCVMRFRDASAGS